MSAAAPEASLGRQQAVVAIGRRAVASASLSILMHDAAALVAETLGVEHYVVVEVSPDGSRMLQRLILQRSAAAEPQVVEQDLSARGGDSLAAYVLEVAHPVIVPRLARETRFHDSLLRRHRIRSAVAAPIGLRDRSFGALAACSGRVHLFDREDALFVEAVAHLVATTAARIRTEQDLAEERRLSTGVLETVAAMVLVLDPQGKIRRINRVCEQLTGFSPDDARGRAIWEVFPVAGEVDLFRRVFQKLREGVSPVEYESSLLTKHSERRRIAWSYAAMRGGNQAVASIIATGIDITPQREAEQEAERAERVAERAQRKVDELLGRTRGADRARPASRGRRSADDDGQPDTLGEPPITINTDRRQVPRRPYRYRQSIAPVFGGRFPTDDQFAEFDCQDISSAGFAFWSPSPPQSELLVVALGTRPNLTHVAVQIAHVTRAEHGGRKMYLIGCSYVGRLEW